VNDLNIPVEIVVCPTVREPDGLALSSRNLYLSPQERETALVISRTLTLAKERYLSGQFEIPQIEAEMWSTLTATPGVEPQYAVIRDPETLGELSSLQDRAVALIAAFVGKTRLIDNLTIHRES
jgi:pantoate--beta-alanine ligase